ncbi:MAG: hypothetical protein FWE48_06375 [Coriobacteriia bacterium]|nr:hypothetical protein [Coriobacteriia bacterium]
MIAILSAIILGGSAVGTATYLASADSLRRAEVVLGQTADDLASLRQDAEAHAALKVDLHREENALWLETEELRVRNLLAEENLFVGGNLVLTGDDGEARLIIDQEGMVLGIPLIAQDITAGAITVTGDIDASFNDVRVGSLSSGNGSFSVTADGHGEFNDLIARGNINASRDLVVNGNTVLSGQLTLGNDELLFTPGSGSEQATLALLGRFSASRMSLHNDLAVGSITVGEVGADGSIENPTATISSEGDITARDLDVRDISAREVQTDTLRADGDVALGSNLAVAGNIVTEGDLTIRDIDARNISASGTLRVAEDATFDSSLAIGGNIAAEQGDLTIRDIDAQNISVSETLQVAGDVTFSSNLAVAGNAVIDGTLYAGGLSLDENNTWVDGVLTASELVVVGGAEIDGNLIVESLTVAELARLAEVEVEGSLAVYGDIISTGNIVTAGDITLDEGSITLKEGDIILGMGDISTPGTITAGAFQLTTGEFLPFVSGGVFDLGASTAITAGSLDLGSGAITAGSLNLGTAGSWATNGTITANTLNLSSNLTVAGNATFSENLTAAQGVQLGLGAGSGRIVSTGSGTSIPDSAKNGATRFIVTPHPNTNPNEHVVSWILTADDTVVTFRWCSDNSEITTANASAPFSWVGIIP